MQEPIFPVEFLDHCPKVRGEINILKRFKQYDGDNCHYAAECAFHSAGLGLQCENCRTWIGRPKMYAVDDFLEPIKQYYRDYEEYEKWLKEQQKYTSGDGI